MKLQYHLIWIFLSITLWNICFVLGEDENTTSFYLYTSLNPTTPQRIYLNKPSTIQKSHFSSKQKTKVLIHGWNESYESLTVDIIKQAYLTTGKYNVIAIDCKSLADPDYATVIAKMNKTAQYIAKFLDFIVETAKISPKDMHILGHGLGAHLAGFSSRFSKNKVSRITGLDPANRLFNEPPNDRLKVNDGLFVDVIHTCAGFYGLMKPIGNVDFFPNGGTPPQPGCVVEILIGCSHMRASFYYAETIKNPDSMFGVQCSDYGSFKAQKCKNNLTIPMGENTPQSTKSGSFYLQTNKREPFGKGKNYAFKNKKKINKF